MFNHTRAPDPQDRRRRHSALLLALLMFFTSGSLLLSADSQAVGIDLGDPLEDPHLVDVVARPAPPAAPAPAPAAAPARASAPAKPAVAAPSAPPPDPTELPAEAPVPPEDTEDAPTDAPAGGSGGPEGEPDGEDIGDDEGGQQVGGGCLPGMVCDGEVLHLTAGQVVPQRRVSPRYPEAAKALGLSEVRCSVRFTIDERGRPEHVAVEGCPEVFHAEVLTAARMWRFYPARDASGRAQRATFTLGLTFRLR